MARRIECFSEGMSGLNMVESWTGLICIHTQTAYLVDGKCSMADPTISKHVWLEEIQMTGVFTLSKGVHGDFEFMACVLDCVRYSQVHDNRFSQWVYLIWPESFQAALEGTIWAGSKLAYLRSSRVFIGDTWFVWDIEVNYLICSCDASGIRVKPRKFRLLFYI